MAIKPATRILCVWEQGANLGHLSHLRLPIEVALRQGHQVFLAARELHRVGEVLGGLPITLLQAPFKQQVAVADQASTLSYTHLIANQCFSNSTELEMYVRAWRALFDLVQPALVLFEHSPTALVAANAYRFKKVLVGSGFWVPAVSAVTDVPFLPFPTTPRSEAMNRRLCADDAQLLGVINAALSSAGAVEIPNLETIFSQSDASFLTTWPVLDHFGERANGRYLGVAPMQINASPRWPQVSAPKVFGYLQYFPAIEQLLRDLQAASVCALLLVRDLPIAIRQAYTSPSMHFADHLLDLRQVAEQVAWVVHHGNHSTMSTFMLAGVPQLVIPRHQEQLFCSLRLVNAGCAAMAFQDQSAFAAAIHAMQTNVRMKQCAQKVATQCAPFDQEAVTAYLHQTFNRLLLDASIPPL
jgi:hypothetical protein